MRERTTLQPNTELRFTNQAGGEMLFVITGVVGFGGSCIVYDGYYRNNAGTESTVRIKECYPYKLHIERKETGELKAAPKDRERFGEYQDRLRKSFEIATRLHETNGLTNLTVNEYDRYEGNGTVYIVSSYVEGRTLAQASFETLRDAVRVVLSTARSLAQLHHHGYLYLDLKPENVLVYPETPDMIQLFDFDSAIPMGIGVSLSEYRVSYSPGFAPLEQKQGDMSRIGRYTDVYSVGALLFYLLFGKAPGAMDCGFEVVYDYTGLRWNTLYQEKVYRELTLLFHHTLQAYAPDRFQDMEAVIARLEVIEKYADLPVPFICSGFVSNSSPVVGRQQECDRLLRWYHSGDKVLFLTGMGGMGKSTVVRKFVSENRDCFDHVVYLQYRGSVCDTVADDMQFCISGCEKDEAESTKEYFLRKLKQARELAAETNTLLVLDNFDGALDESFTELLKVDWKIILVTRRCMRGLGYTCEELERLKDEKELLQLFESHMGRRLELWEQRKLVRMVEKVAGHTLVLVLIARQIARSYLSMEEAFALVEEKGFSRMASEKVDFARDGQVLYDKVSGLIQAVYDVSGLAEEKRKCLKLLSLFDAPGIEIREAQRMLKLESLDDINELRDLGWLEVAERDVQMHPLVQETLHQTEWKSEYRELALEEMQVLYEELGGNDRWKYSGKGQESVVSKPHEGMFDSKRHQRVLFMSQSVLSHCENEVCLAESEVYKELLFLTLMELPREQEAYITRYAEKLFQDGAFDRPYSVMELYDYVVFLQCQKESYSKAQECLKRAEAFAEKHKEPYTWGLYYEMAGDFYEALLDGGYLTQNAGEEELLKRLMVSADKAVHYMKRAKLDKAKLLYVKYVLGKAALMIRSVPKKRRRIKVLMLTAKSALEQVMQEAAKGVETAVVQEKDNSNMTELCSVYAMVWAWYYTLCEPEEQEVLHFLQKAARKNEERVMSDLDRVDYFYIPAANMMCELGNIEKTLYWLEEAFALCNAHRDSLPYIRKKLDLLRYELEVYEEEGDGEGAGRIRQRMEQIEKEEF